MWTPTHIQIIVNQARNLRCKGKSGTNDAYVVIQLGKEKYQTSVKERSVDPAWNEECSLSIDGNIKLQTAKLTVFHRNLLGLDEYLGQVTLPLSELSIYERPKSRWHQLEGKPTSKNKEKDRGELEITTMFYVQSISSNSQLELTNKTSSGRRVSIKNLANTLGDKLGGKRWSSRNSVSQKSLGSAPHSAQSMLDVSYLPVPRSLNLTTISDSVVLTVKSASQQSLNNENSSSDHDHSSIHHRPSVVSMTADVTDSPSDVFSCDVTPGNNMSVSMVTSPEKRPLSSVPGALRASELRHTSSLSKISAETSTTTPSKASKKSWLSRKSNKSIASDAVDPIGSSDCVSQLRGGGTCRPCDGVDLRGGEGGLAAYELQELHDYLKKKQNEKQTNMTKEASQLLAQFNNYEKEDLIRLMLDQQTVIERKEHYIRDLEDYIDNLLVKVIESEPRLLQNPYEPPATVRSHEIKSHDYLMYGSRTLPRSSNSSNGNSVIKSATQTCIKVSSVSKPGVYVPGSRFPSLGGVSKVPAAKTGKSERSKRNGGLLISPLKKLGALIT